MDNSDVNDLMGTKRLMRRAPLPSLPTTESTVSAQLLSTTPATQATWAMQATPVTHNASDVLTAMSKDHYPELPAIPRTVAMQTYMRDLCEFYDRAVLLDQSQQIVGALVQYALAVNTVQNIDYALQLMGLTSDQVSCRALVELTQTTEPRFAGGVSAITCPVVPRNTAPVRANSLMTEKLVASYDVNGCARTWLDTVRADLLRRVHVLQEYYKVTTTINGPAASAADAPDSKSPFQPLRFTPGTEECRRRFATLIGLDTVKEQIRRTLVYPTMFPLLYNTRKLPNILLYGPPGTGKTFIMQAAANELQTSRLRVLVYSVTGDQLKGSFFGQSEKNIRALYEAASAAACECQLSRTDGEAVSLIVLDEVESLAPDRNNDPTGLAATTVNALLQTIGGVVAYKNVCTVAMTNYPWQLDAAFVRRFSNRIFVDLPGDTHIVELIHSTLSRHVRTVLTGAQHDYQRYCARLASSKRSRLERLKDEMDASMKRCQDECTADDKRPDADGHYLWQRSTIVRHYLRQVTDVTLATYAAKLKERLYSNSDIVAWMNNVFMQMADDALMCNTFVRLEGTALAQLKQSFGDALRLDGTTGDGRDGLSHLYVSTLCFEDDELAGMDDKIYVAEQTVSESAYQFDTSDPDLEHLDPAGLHIEKGTYQFWQTSTDCYLRITDRRIRNLYVLRRDGDYDMIWAFDFSLAVGDTASTTEPEVHQKRLWLRSIVPSVTWGQSFGRLLATFGTLFGGEGPAVVAGTTAIARHDTHIQLLLDNLKQVFARVDHMNDAGEYALLAVGSSEKSTLQQIVTSGTASVPRAVFQQSAGKSLLHLLLGNKTYQPCTWVSQPGRLLKTLAADEHTLMVTLFCDASHFERALAEVPSSGNKHMIDEIRRYAKDPSTFTFQAPPKKKE